VPERRVGQGTDSGDGSERVSDDDRGPMSPTAQVIDDVDAPERDRQDENAERRARNRDCGFVQAEEEKNAKAGGPSDAVCDGHPTGHLPSHEVPNREESACRGAEEEQADGYRHGRSALASVDSRSRSCCVQLFALRCSLPASTCCDGSLDRIPHELLVIPIATPSPACGPVCLPGCSKGKGCAGW
jgi:hypothetical protein